MSYLERLQAKAAQRADSALPKGSEAPFNTFGSDRTGQIGELAADCTAGLHHLQNMPAPRTINVGKWATVVRDAKALADDGWAAKALALGWSDLDLFGAVTDRDGDPCSDGLAVWLRGRTMLALCSTFAIAENDNVRAYFNRREQVGAKLLWDLAK